MRKFLSILVLGLLVLPLAAWAADATGTAERDVLVDIMSGKVGLGIGFIGGILGLYIWIVLRRSWGLVLIVLSTMFTALPGLYEQAYNGLNSALGVMGVTRNSIDII